MKVTIIILTLCLIACFIKTIRNKSFELNNFDLSNTIPLRGIMALIIVMLHIDIFYIIKDNSGYQSIIITGPIMVGVFFVSSGYGLVQSYLKKGDSYLSNFPKLRLTKLLIPYLIVFALYLAEEMIFCDYKLISLINNLPRTENFVPNTWYVFVIVIFYTFFYISFKYINNKKIALGLMFVLTLIWVLIIKYIGWGWYWWSTAFAFPIGTLFGYYEVPIKDFINRRRILSIAIAGAIIAVSSLYALCNSQTSLELPCGDQQLYWFLPLPIVMFIYFLGFPKFKFLNFFGKISYEIYIIHGIFVLKFAHLRHNFWLYSLIVYSLTIITSIAVQKLGAAISKKIK